jgi:hypothetical protein
VINLGLSLDPELNVKTRAYHSRSKKSSGNFVVPATLFRLGDRAFSVTAARAWNVLPTEMKSTHVTQTFKRKLKTFLYDYNYTD